jgi:hypothetical protein
MGAKKVKELAVKTGSYTDNQGQQRGRYENVGSLMKNDDGSFFVLLKRTFNPAGVAVQDGKDQVLISVFDLKDNSQNGGQSGGGYQAQGAATGGAGQAGGAYAGGGGRADMDEEIPF